jgi:hypothetical protein
VFVRFQGGVLLVVLVAVGGTALEGESLDRRRAISRQQYRTEVLRERVARLRLKAEELGSPARLARPTEPGRLAPAPASAAAAGPIAGPLLRWRSPQVRR